MVARPFGASLSVVGAHGANGLHCSHALFTPASPSRLPPLPRALLPLTTAGASFRSSCSGLGWTANWPTWLNWCE